MAQLTMPAIRVWDPELLWDAMGAARKRGEALVDFQGRIESIGTFEGWYGYAGYAARGSFGEVGRSVLQMAADSGAMETATREAHEALVPVKERLRNVDGEAGPGGFDILDDGAVVDLQAENVDDADEVREREETRARLEGEARGIVTDAGVIDDDLAAQLRAIADGKVETGLPDGVSLTDDSVRDAIRNGKVDFDLPPEGLAATGARRGWEELSEHERDALIRTRPELLRNLHGLPTGARHLAGMGVLYNDELSGLDDLRARRDELRANLDGRFHRWTNGRFTDDDEELWAVERRIADIERLREVMAPSVGVTLEELQRRENSGDHPRYLLF